MSTLNLSSQKRRNTGNVRNNTPNHSQQQQQQHGLSSRNIVPTPPRLTSGLIRSNPTNESINPKLIDLSGIESLGGIDNTELGGAPNASFDLLGAFSPTTKRVNNNAQPEMSIDNRYTTDQDAERQDYSINASKSFQYSFSDLPDPLQANLTIAEIRGIYLNICICSINYLN